MLLNLVITPDVFTEAGYSSADRCPDCLGQLRRILLEESLVRDLRNGEWSAHLQNPATPCHKAGRELVEALLKQGRLRRVDGNLPTPPEEPSQWCWEALASHKRETSDGIIAGAQTAAEADSLEVCAAERMHESQWWQGRSCSLTVNRCAEDYLRQLNPILRRARHVMFIDPHLDPSKPHYAEFRRILETMRGLDPRPLIEIHRSVYDSSGGERREVNERQVRDKFTNLDHQLCAAGLKAEVHVWDRFHDRFLITNLVGILLSNGFDGPAYKDERTRWARLSPPDRDGVQREFDPSYSRREHRICFAIGSP